MKCLCSLTFLLTIRCNAISITKSEIIKCNTMYNLNKYKTNF